jgi:hypothetical protein
MMLAPPYSYQNQTSGESMKLARYVSKARQSGIPYPLIDWLKPATKPVTSFIKSFKERAECR